MAFTLTLDPHHLLSDALIRATEYILAGKIVAFPTETFYALGASAYNEEALGKVFQIKGRPFNKPLPLLIEDLTMLEQVVTEIPPLASNLMRTFWPGGLTLIFKASPRIPPLVTAHTSTVAVRISSHPVAQALVKSAGTPLTSTSANLSGQRSCFTAQEVEVQLGDCLDLIIDSGPTAGQLPSTIVDLTVSPPAIVREGIISSHSLKPFLL